MVSPKSKRIKNDKGKGDVRWKTAAARNEKKTKPNRSGKSKTQAWRSKTSEASKTDDVQGGGCAVSVEERRGSETKKKKPDARFDGPSREISSVPGTTVSVETPLMSENEMWDSDMDSEDLNFSLTYPTAFFLKRLNFHLKKISKEIERRKENKKIWTLVHSKVPKPPSPKLFKKKKKIKKKKLSRKKNKKGEIRDAIVIGSSKSYYDERENKKRSRGERKFESKDDRGRNIPPPKRAYSIDGASHFQRWPSDISSTTTTTTKTTSKNGSALPDVNSSPWSSSMEGFRCQSPLDLSISGRPLSPLSYRSLSPKRTVSVSPSRSSFSTYSNT